jgi:hypothetical protein
MTMNAEPSGPTSLHLRVLKAAIRKTIEGAEVKPEKPSDTEPVARWAWDPTTMINSALNRVWCMGAEASMNRACDFIRDNWDDLSEDDIKELEGLVVDLLEKYEDRC